MLGHDPTTEAGRTLRQCVPFQQVHSLLDCLSWDPEEFKADPSRTAYHQDDCGQLFHLRTNQTKQVDGLITHMRHIFESYNSGPDLPDNLFHPCTPVEWETQTATDMRTYLLPNRPGALGPNPVASGPIPSSRPTSYSTAAQELMGFKKDIKREIAAYPILKNERYLDSFSRTHPVHHQYCSR